MGCRGEVPIAICFEEKYNVVREIGQGQTAEIPVKRKVTRTFQLLPIGLGMPEILSCEFIVIVRQQVGGGIRIVRFWVRAS